jgi:hypothetical protein
MEAFDNPQTYTVGDAVTFKSGIPWPVQPENLPTYDGNRPGKNEVRKAEMEAGGMKGIRRVDWTDAQGTEYIMNTRNGFPEVVSTKKVSIVIPVAGDGIRGFIAYVNGTINAARFSPYTLSVLDPAYKIFNHTYTVLPFETTYNVPLSDTTSWFDVISFYAGKVLINGKEMTTLQIPSVSPTALPWLIPHAGSGEAKYGDEANNAYEKRVFAIYRDRVHSWMSGATDAVLNNPTARPGKALMCGSAILPDTHETWLAQFAFTGSSWNDLSGGWAYTSAKVAMTLASPYLAKTDYGVAAEQSVCTVSLTGSEYVTGTIDSMEFPPAEIGLAGNGALGFSSTYARHVVYPANRVIEGNVLGGHIIGTRSGPAYDGATGGTVNLGEKTATVACTSTYRKKRYVGQAQNDTQLITVNSSPAPSYTSIVCIDETNPVIDTGGVRGNDKITVGGWTGQRAADYYRESSGAEFSVIVDGENMVAGSATRTKVYGSEVRLTKIPWATNIVSGGGGYAYHTCVITADTFYPASIPGAVQHMIQLANGFVGQGFISSVSSVYELGSHYTEVLATRPTIDDRVLNWTTKDYLLYDEENGCYISVDATFVGQQVYGANGSAVLSVRMNISTPAGNTSELLFDTTLTYLDLLPEVELDGVYTYVPAPMQRVIFTPKYRGQGDFTGAVYTTEAEFTNGAQRVYLFNFVLKLDTYAAIGTDQSGNTTINFIPCNLIEMLYAYVYSSKYGIDPDERYPVDNVPWFNAFQTTLFGTEWHIAYRNGSLMDWLDSLGGQYVTETKTRVFRT